MTSAVLIPSSACVFMKSIAAFTTATAGGSVVVEARGTSAAPGMRSTCVAGGGAVDERVESARGRGVCREDASVESAAEQLVDLVVVERGARADYAQVPVGARVRVLQDSRHSQPSVRAVGRNCH